MREHFDRSVRYLPDPAKYVVCLRHFRAEIQVEEAGFFVREFEAASGEIRLSDGTREALDAGSLRTSPRDGAWLCSVKTGLVPGGLAARFCHSAQASLLESVEERAGGLGLVVAGRFRLLPAGLA